MSCTGVELLRSVDATLARSHGVGGAHTLSRAGGARPAPRQLYRRRSSRAVRSALTQSAQRRARPGPVWRWALQLHARASPLLAPAVRFSRACALSARHLPRAASSRSARRQRRRDGVRS